METQSARRVSTPAPSSPRRERLSHIITHPFLMSRKNRHGLFAQNLAPRARPSINNRDIKIFGDKTFFRYHSLSAPRAAIVLRVSILDRTKKKRKKKKYRFTLQGIRTPFVKRLLSTHGTPFLVPFFRAACNYVLITGEKSGENARSL